MKSPTALRLLVILAVGISVLSACAPAPSPSPTPSPAFTSEEDAFAAAEATFAAYIDALNRVDFSMPESFEDVFATLSGQASTSTRSAFSEFHANGVRASGVTTFTWVSGESVNLSNGEVIARVCIDVSGVEVTSAAGSSIVAPDRPSRQPTIVTFAPTSSAASTISELESSEDFSCGS
ncbi:hypothetical protein [Microbacterium sp. BLY]|uniref:hypothetical protein n=1 Tax=Microbacterium sp. BLY TaxID=2823280 RepID=UPI001B340874|nr:hypothetical protein [Microbacterium sp. BLY]MBP3978762.1 hypothetical protein [Microbacterium sp. BLY]